MNKLLIYICSLLILTLTSASSFADIGADVLQAIEKDRPKEQVEAAKKRAPRNQDPDRADAPHFLPPDALQGAQSIAKDLPLGTISLSPEALIKSGKIPASVSAMSDVLYFGNDESNQGANSGIIAYVSKSILTEDELFSSAYRFYSELRKKDATRKNQDYKLTPIQEKAEFNVYRDIALPAAHGNSYLALKTLLVFGHDNINTALLPFEGPGRLWIINRLSPEAIGNSTLYLNGSIGARYSASDEAAGKQRDKCPNQPTLAEC